ncbi:hypothetical protein ACFYTS_28090 [Nocardia sp. NPDC004151]|uniref:hypothetical protein n=1 Tax=Nocardia sp. NPDC004151 TaxID=3364304 RepID=UPI0036AEF707
MAEVLKTAPAESISAKNCNVGARWGFDRLGGHAVHDVVAGVDGDVGGFDPGPDHRIDAVGPDQ